MKVSLQGDWPEDTTHENGNYHSICVHCGNMFIGHKRRVTCKVCAELPAMEPTPAEEAAELLSEAIDYKRRCHQYEAAILAAGGTTGYGEHGEVVVTWPKEWRILWGRGLVFAEEAGADRWILHNLSPETKCRKQSRTAPGPWQDPKPA